MARNRKTKTGDETSIRGGWLYFEDARQCPVENEYFLDIIDHPTVTTIRVISLSTIYEARVWVSEVSGFGTEQIDMEFTLRKEVRRNGNYWYAYRKFGNKLHKKYVGASEGIDEKKLLDIARALPGRTFLKLD